MNCPRCGGKMGASDFYFDGSKCTSWVCYRCGEVIDEQILINQGVTMRKDARRIGELVPAVERRETGRGKKLPEVREDSDIPTQRLSEFRKLAEIPIAEVKPSKASMGQA